MAQSTTNLGKIHVFPSETLYNQFKDIIADNDLALLKDDGAYIVAALLEQNGYVKFNNGLILQWGRSTAATLNFSLPFQKFYCITTAQESWGSATFDNTSWITRTNISVTWPTYRGTNINYIAVGM
nr:MAG TPA: putative tail fiber protein [Caudoviricetes sp.]